VAKPIARMLLIVGICVAIGVAGLQAVHTLRAGSEQLYEDGTVPLSRAAQTLAAMHRDRIAVRNHMLAPDAAGKADALKVIQSEDERIATELAAFLALNPPAQERQMAERFRRNWGSYTQVRDEQMIPLSAEGRIAEARVALTSRQPQAKKAEEALNALFALQVHNGETQMNKNRDAADDLSRNILLLVICGLVLSVTLAVPIVAPGRGHAGRHGGQVP
jgi:Four helix bundle sensory module for signal transduction